MKKEHEEFLVKFFQSEHNNALQVDTTLDTAGKHEPSDDMMILVEDGIYGPNTAAEINKYLRLDTFIQVAWDFAMADVGRGGNGYQNNVGEYISEIRAYTNLPQLGSGAWCAVAVSYWLRRAGYTGITERSVTRLHETALELGWQELDDAFDMVDGEVCIGIYASGGQNRGKHVRLVRRLNAGLYQHIGGNEYGDAVRTSNHTENSIERRLITLLRYTP